MFVNRYAALVEARSLVGVWRRNLLLSLAEAEFFRLRWSQTILDKTERALKRPGTDAIMDVAMPAMAFKDGDQYIQTRHRSARSTFF